MLKEESKLLMAFSKGDQRAFEQLFKAYYDATCHYVMRVIRDSDTTEEVVQSTFVNLWEKRELIRPDINFKSYLFRSAYNTALNYIKHQKVVSNYVAKKQEKIGLIQQDYVSHQPDFELQKKITDAINELPPQCQKVFRMSREEGLKYHEIAEELSISKKTVEIHIGKALKILRLRLKDYLGVEVLICLGVEVLRYCGGALYFSEGSIQRILCQSVQFFSRSMDFFYQSAQFFSRSMDFFYQSAQFFS